MLLSRNTAFVTWARARGLPVKLYIEGSLAIM